MNFRVPVMRPKLPELNAVIPYLKEMNSNRIFSNRGPLISRLEFRFSNFLGVDHDSVVACANATLGLTGLARILGNKRFIAPSYTFSATLHALVAAGRTVELADIDESSWECRTIPASRDVVLVRVSAFGSPPFFGDSINWDFLIVDAAASIGSSINPVGPLPSNVAVVYSLHATKVLGIGEGCVVAFGDTSTASEFRKWINFGFDGSRSSQFPAMNAKLSEVSAAYGLAALDSWPTERAEWLQSRKLVDEVSGKLGIDSNLELGTRINPYWIVKLPDEQVATRLERILGETHIGSRKWWAGGCHKMPAFSNLGGGQSFPITEKISSETLGLPFFRGLETEAIELVADCCKKALGG